MHGYWVKKKGLQVESTEFMWILLATFTCPTSVTVLAYTQNSPLVYQI